MCHRNVRDIRARRTPTHPVRGVVGVVVRSPGSEFTHPRIEN
jgi:hypothetical protein